jgi:ubiquinone/menaquinone biosynthesis C-methylase UbiE
MTPITWIILIVVALILLGVVLYWQLVIAEGAYLGRRVVAILYDWFAPRYDRTKGFLPGMDMLTLALPIMRHLSRRANLSDATTPFVLDVATGTGRLPATLLAQSNFRGHIIGLDASGRMLAMAQVKLAQHVDRITWLKHDAQQLPFDDGYFEVVACLESIEFFPQPLDAVIEMLRVLKPGGLLMLSNRIGPDAWKMPGRTMPTSAFVTWLEQHGLRHVESESWLVDYDLIKALK